jgi:hypothetical protein
MGQFIQSPEEYRAAIAMVRAKVLSNERLPNQVFSSLQGRLSFMSGDLVLSTIFWEAIQKINEADRKSRGGEVLMMLLDPYVDSFYQKHSIYAAVRFDKTTLAEDYVEALAMPYCQGSNDCMALSGSNFVFIPKVGEWTVWAHRGDEICIANYKETISTGLGCDWTSSAEQALAWFIKPSFLHGVIPQDFEKKFMSNYAFG